jgi:type II restriction/modification system DNA methylase subunit YeeA
MNTNAIKRYAPKARTAFIAAMSKRAALFGIRESTVPSLGIAPLEIKGDLALITDSTGTQRAFPASIARPRAALAQKVEQLGFAQTMEQAAYSWFNRLCALRYMEIKGYLDHGRRVLSAADGSAGMPQILEDCLDIELEGLDKARITELKLDGNKDEELYRELLLTQCHALHQAMPFLFEAVDDALELLLPDNLTKTDSLIRELVAAIPEEDWHNVEIIGWLYQFYISEKKDQVIGKVVKSEDIPAATQLFTPNWIVQYLVQNSLGRQWLQTYPDSPLNSREKMPYYVPSGAQPPEVQAQLAASTPESIDPQTIKVLDPACGSGHILVEAYKLLKEIYTERGFRSRDIPQLILENNLFGLDIDDRAGQLAGFALMMLAREDDRRIFSRELKLNVLALQESRHLDLSALWHALNLTSDWQRGQSQGLFDSEQSNLAAAQADNRYQLLRSTLQRFTQAKTFGSLIEVPAEDAAPLAELLAQLRELTSAGDSMQKPAAEALLPYVQQAWILAQRYDAVIANPPYMGSKGMNAELKAFAEKNHPKSKDDLFAIFMERSFGLLVPNGYNSQINMHSWMFISSYVDLREVILRSKTIVSMAHLGAKAFSQVSGEKVQTVAWIIANFPVAGYRAKFFNLTDGKEEQKKELLLKKENQYTVDDQLGFFCIPGAPIQYWTESWALGLYGKFETLSPRAVKGLDTNGAIDKFLRLWHEISIEKFSVFGGKKWFPLAKGGGFRKWYGNHDYVINYEFDGSALKANKANLRNKDRYGMEGCTWTVVSTSGFSVRYMPEGFLFDQGGSAIFCLHDDACSIECLIASLNSVVGERLAKDLCPTLNFTTGDVNKIPLITPEGLEELGKKAIAIAKKDWDLSEMSWDFRHVMLRNIEPNQVRLLDEFEFKVKTSNELIAELSQTEREINSAIKMAAGVEIPLSANPAAEKITLSCNPIYRYGGALPESLAQDRVRYDFIYELISYSLGCIMGRYSLDREGLVYAHAGNAGFSDLVAEGAYKTFPADSDGILPLTDQEWFTDDATNRFREFIRVVWGEEHLQQNLDFVAESLCLHAIKPKKGEASLDTIRRYLSTQFFKDHLRTYKKRPIYWLFSSGKHKAFECLVYLHRYNEGTLARMRTEYVIPLTAKLATYATKLEKDLEASTSTAEKKALEKQLATLHNQQAELATFDEKLRHHADQRISLDLDDGVKVNYGKFGDLLAEVKAVTGGKEDS